jgi:hypothetical protein
MGLLSLDQQYHGMGLLSLDHMDSQEFVTIVCQEQTGNAGNNFKL